MATTNETPQEQTNPEQVKHKNIHAALLAAKKNMGEVFKNASNPHFQSQYADLGNIIEVVEGPLQNEGILLSQPFYTVDSTQFVKTVLYHVDSDTSIECEVEVKSANANDPQKVGSALTYYRRYTLQSVLGIAPKDDDGNAAAPPPPTKTTAPDTKPSAPAATKTAPPAVPAKAPAPAADRLPCENPGCKNTIRAAAEKENRDMHEGHIVCQFHSTNGSWQAAFAPKPASFGPAPQGVDQDMYDAAEALSLESKNFTTAPDGTVEFEEAA